VILHGKKAKETKEADAGLEGLRNKRRQSGQENINLPQVRSRRFYG